ncbi:MAG: phytanoyl-CoA dioxygenase family protein [candidate division Zixibacteria bacterium]|nr:phytanoyl-CoA dioxygenase family protein [candidate division Zixibacteria bacterium]
MSLSLEETIRTLKRDGIVTVEGVFSEREMTEFRGLLDKTIIEALQVDRYKGRPTDKLLGRAKDTVWLLWELYAVCEGGLRFTRHPAIVRVLETALGEPAIQSSIGTMFDKVSGGDAEIGWHQDNFFIMLPSQGCEVDWGKTWHQFNHIHVRPTELKWTEDYFKKTIIVRINVDAQTIENGCMRIIPGSYHEGPLELKGGQEEYVKTRESEAVDCVAGMGSVTFYFPTTLHSSGRSIAPEGTHRRAAAHRVRGASLRIPDWDWPTDWEGALYPIMPETGFDRNPFA